LIGHAKVVAHRGHTERSSLSRTCRARSDHVRLVNNSRLSDAKFTVCHRSFLFGDHFFLYDNGGSGPSLKFAGADFVADQFGSWTPIAAERTAGGYEVALQNGSADQYTVWNTDSSGNYLSNIGAVSGADYALQSLEPSFHQDLNHDEHWLL
jgi:hypothetical protein